VERKYGWIHSCGLFHYQLDNPIACRLCNEKGEWLWYDSQPVNEIRKDDVHGKNHPHNRPGPNRPARRKD